LLTLVVCSRLLLSVPTVTLTTGNGELLRQYGFVIDGVDSATGLSNSNDTVDLLVRWPELEESDPLLQVRGCG
jgi:hypothetical protein